ncbi:MAG TPA: methionine--tRNA ligase [Candidatus Bathyarchaeia archaeon]|nr:methionine--tRNA ligase [Candidatus Bathyarchaeia archaeon]
MVCSAWPYVNDRPHLGTFTHLLSADVYSRYLRLKGEDVIMVSGSDEHGAPIEVEALKRNIKPRQLTNQYHRVFVKSLRRFNIRFDNYTRTESLVHKRYVKEFYQRLEKNGYVYTENIVLPYCESDKRFLPDRFVEGECPYCHSTPARGDQCDNCGRVLDPKDLIKPYCVLDHSTPVLRESKTWFFDLPKLTDKLTKYIEGNANLPENAKNFSLSWLREGLKPRSITRDLKWGIKAPFKGSEDKTIYVWMEAVLGYISAAKEYSEKVGKPNLWKKFWLNPQARNVHFIGKDNIPFHTIVFPGLLLATELGYSLPWQVSSTEYVQFDGQRFSKSRKIGIWIDEAIQLEEAEYWRYALISLRPEQKDTNFTWEEFERKINTELNDVIGNFVHRTITFIIARFDGRVPPFTIDQKRDGEILTLLVESARIVDDDLQRFRLKEALEHVLRLAREGNRYLNEREPWRTIKTDMSSAAQTLGVTVQIVASIAIQLQPFLPEASEKIFKSLSLGKKTALKHAGLVNLKPGQRIRPLKPLFHKVSASSLRDQLERLRGPGAIETAA